MGGSLNFGFPVPGAARTRVFTGYSVARTRYELFSDVEDTSLFGLPPDQLRKKFLDGAGPEVKASIEDVPDTDLARLLQDLAGHNLGSMLDAYAACERIRQAGGQVTREPGPVKGGSTVIAFVTDPDGYKIELIQRESTA